MVKVAAESDLDDASSIPPIAPLFPDSLEEAKSDESSILTLSDYSPATWGKIVSYGVPTVGIAFLAVAHPLLLLAGAGLFFGVGGAYANISMPDCVTICGRSGTRGAKESKSSDSDPVLPHQVTIATVVSTDSSDDLESRDELMHVEPQESKEDPSSSIPPPLSNMIVEEEFVSLHAKDFFQIFFGDDAPFSFKDFQKQRGDIDIAYSAWGNSRERTLLFKTPTRTPFLGPTHAQATKTQVLAVYSKSCVVMEATTSLVDIPYCDRFVVCEQWVFTSTPEKICTLRVSAQANFSKPCPFQSQIETKTSATLREVLSSWRDMAQKALIVTERKRRREQEPKCNDEVEVAYKCARKSSCVVGEETEDNEDWEMDPVPARSQRRTSFQALRNTLSMRFTKKHSDTVLI
jgi:VAD1 Analog of StAR-related lipid transfer domain